MIITECSASLQRKLFSIQENEGEMVARRAELRILNS